MPNDTVLQAIPPPEHHAVPTSFPTSLTPESRRQGSRRQRRQSQSVMSWMWLKICCHVRRRTFEFFDAVDCGRVSAIRDMVQLSPALLLRTRPGTRWTAVHFAAERGEFSTLIALFEEAAALESCSAPGRGKSCLHVFVEKGDFTRSMVNGAVVAWKG